MLLARLTTTNLGVGTVHQRRWRVAALAPVVSLSLVACGGDDGGGGGSEPQAPVGSPRQCLQSFNEEARASFRALASMLHIDGNDVVVGIYAGDGYSAETVDSGAATGDDRNATVGRGDCVVYETPDAVDRPLYTFVRTGETWHRFAETDPRNELTSEPRGQLGARTSAALEGIGADAKLVAGP